MVDNTYQLLLRIIYTCKMAWVYRASLKAYRHNNHLQIKDVKDLSPSDLYAAGFRIIGLDFDGVLAAQGEAGPDADLVPWLHLCIQVFGKDRVFLLSNNLTLERNAFFSNHFPEICLIENVRKKPYPDGIEWMLQKSLVLPQEALVVDDRLLTGILAAIISGTEARFVKSSRRNFKKRPCQELFFMILRGIEHILL